MQAGVAILDRVANKIEGVAKAYVRGLKRKLPQPGPEGSDQLMDALRYLATHSYEPEEKEQEQDNGD